MNSLVAIPVLSSELIPAPALSDPRVRTEDLETIWNRRKSLIIIIRQLLRDVETDKDFDSYEEKSAPVLQAILEMTNEVVALPNSSNKLGAQALLALEEFATGVQDTPNNCSEEAGIIIDMMGSLSLITTGVIAKDISDLLRDGNHPIRQLSCLCP